MDYTKLTLKKIQKRDGRVVEFEPSHISRAISLAVAESKEFDEKETKRLTDIVVGILEKVYDGKLTPTVEQIQDVVEQVLMAAGHYDTARRYIIYRDQKNKEREVKKIIGVTDDLGLPLNSLKVLESRFLMHDSRGNVVETPKQMFMRVAKVLASVEKKKDFWTEKFFEVMKNLEFLPAGRTLNNAGTPQNQLANCFVLPIEDSMEKIFDAVKWTAIVHQKGGGCIAAGSKVFTSFCGLENFEVLYERLGGKMVERRRKDGWSIALEDRNIRTLALDPDTGRYVGDKVREIWRYELPAERVYTIKAQGNLEVTTSDWHPFFLFEDGKIVERRADEIQEGDYLLSTNASITEDSWLFNEYQTLDGVKVDERIGWLVGFILGGRYVRLRLFDGIKEMLEKAAEIFQDFSAEPIKIQKDNRCETYYLATTNKKVTAFWQKLTGITGPKGKDLTISSLLIKSPVSVVSAVLAGLLDSDGYVAKSRKRVDFATESKEMAEQIISLMGLLGIHAAMRQRKPAKQKWHMMYEVKLDNPQNMKILSDNLLPYMIHPEKKERLARHAASSVGHLRGMASPLLWPHLRKYLVKAGLPVNTKLIHKSALVVGNEKMWLHRLKWGDTISVPGMMRLLSSLLTLNLWTLGERKELEVWMAAHKSMRRVVVVERAGKGGEFYDFTTERFHNYLAGKNGLTAVHNTGFNFSHLRPKGDVVTKSSGGFATGPVSFMKVFDTATRQVMQGGKKRGANMGILNVDHPDILEFITCKEVEGEISNFNISVGVTDKFMEAVLADKNYELINPRNGEVVKRLSARTVFDQITALAWRTGDPGMIFLDAINRNNPLLEKYGPIEATNPCGEQPLYPFDACNLGSINLAKFVKVAGAETAPLQNINWNRLAEVVKIAVRMLDNVIDACNYPLLQISETVRLNRRIGLGVMGWADMLYQLGISYNSDEGIKLAEKVAKFIQDNSWEASEEIASEKGVFPRWKDSSFAKKRKKVRNLSITTIAPTGSISMAADCSSGIEPVFALSYTKNVVSDSGLIYTNKYFEQAIEGMDRDLILKEVAKMGSVAGVYGVPRDLQKVFVVSHDIAPEWHVKMQAAWQKYTDNAVSKTINFPFEATIDDVEKAYISAWKAGCKGITVYRDRSKDVQILMKSSSNENGNNGGGYIIQSKIKMKPLEKEDDRKCPDCGGKMIFEEGCAKCSKCGYGYCKG